MLYFIFSKRKFRNYWRCVARRISYKYALYFSLPSRSPFPLLFSPSLPLLSRSSSFLPLLSSLFLLSTNLCSFVNGTGYGEKYLFAIYETHCVSKWPSLSQFSLPPLPTLLFLLSLSLLPNEYLCSLYHTRENC